MTSGRGAYLRVGLLLAAGLALAVALALFLVGNRIRHGRTFESYFRESVQGLEVGAPVKFRGVTLGQVTDIGMVAALYFGDESLDLDRDTTRLVFVRYVIDIGRTGHLADTASVVRAGLRARLASQGITGLAYIELDFVDPAHFPLKPVPWTPEYDIIPSVPSTLAQVQDAAQALLAKINAIDIVAIGQSAQRLLDDVHGQLAAGGDAQQALAGTAALMASAREAVERADLPGLTAELRATAAGLRGVVGGKQVRDMLAASTRAADRLADASGKLPALVTALETAVRRTTLGADDLQADFAPVLRDARAAAANLRDTTEALRRYPAGVLLGAPPPRENDR